MFRTTDLERAREEVARAFCPHRLELLERGGALDAVYNSASLGFSSLNYLHYGGRVRVVPGELRTFFLVNIPLGGSARFRIGRTVLTATTTRGVVLSPDAFIDMEWAAGTQQLIVQMERAALERRLAGLLGESLAVPLRFAALLDATAPRTRSWLRLLLLVRNELEQRSKPDLRMLLQLEELTMTGLLLAQPNNYSERLQTAPARAACRAVRRAVEFMHAHCGEPLSVAQISDAAGVGPRALQAAFRRDLAVSPTAYLRDLRLERVHAEIVSSAGTSTVTEIALRHGFGHTGRFAAAYRARYGVSPSMDLRQ